MALFYYQALERNGRKTKGMIEADSARHARQLLRGKELIPVHIEARMNTSSGGMLQRRRHAHRRVAAADLALFTRQLATLVQAAMPLETCLQAVSEQSEKLHVKSLGMALRSRIQEGYTLSDSLREHPRVFDSLFCSMVAAGEKSGHLDVVLNRLADYTEQRQRLKSRLLQAMLYPLVLLVVATGVVTILLTAVVPKIIEQFDHLGHALPASTRMLIAMSDALQASGVYWLAGLLGLLVLGQRLLKILPCACAGIKPAAFARDGACCARTEYGAFFPHVKHPHRQQCSAAGRHSDRRRRVGKSLCRATTAAGGRSRPRRKQLARRAGGVAPVPADDAVHDRLRRTER
ncbi:hypothetical protein ECZU36_26150 [Escherichia coli]|nr:hypothetical protein ECZU36_26150 [Escherichia coli]